MRKAITNNEVQFSSKVFDMQDEDVKAVSHDFLFVIRRTVGWKIICSLIARLTPHLTERLCYEN